ncbi:hypothetical protein [Pseudokineococcus sp. 1T1Z-3]|uniref:hypothetical protein n=1 Tax=Pseudokineococcus sp. 1T1Z-3 TaxID=3132745 RepID=UPI0030A335FE
MRATIKPPRREHPRRLRARRLVLAVAVSGTALLAAAPAGASGSGAGPTTAALTGTAATPTVAATSSVLPTSPPGGIFGPTSVWRQDVSRAPLAPDSAAKSAHLFAQVKKYYGQAAFNAYQYNTSVYTVPADQPRIDVAFDNCQGKDFIPPQLFTPSRGGHFLSVPMPDDAIPAAARDAQLTIYSPSTDQLWEFWRAKKTADGWSACWGGRLDDVSTSHGFFPDGTGASASGLAVAAGSIRVEEVQRGYIDHALSLAIPSPAHWKTYSWPAQRSDGGDTSPAAIPEGTRLRLDPSIDVDSLRLHPIAKMVARSAQKYGFIVTDKSGAVSIQTESGRGTWAVTGRDPWPALLNGPQSAVMKNFPWQSIQVLPHDYGKDGVTAQCRP